MKRSTGVGVLALIFIVGFVLASGFGPARQTAIAATAQATAVATNQSPEATAESGTESTPAPTRSSGQNTPDFIQAPLPTAGAIGIVLGGTDSPVRLQSIVPDSPAAKAGLEAGDEVLAVNGNPIKNRDSLITVITESKPGTVLTFTIQRGAAQMDIKVTVGTRGAIYCPLPAPNGKPGKSLAKDPLDDPINWVLAPSQSGNVILTVENGKLAFETDNPEGEWGGIATLKTNRVAEFIYSAEVTQSSQAAAGLVFNYRATAGFYILQVLPNGTWTMSAIFPDGTAGGGLSFTDPNIKTANLNDLNSTTKNTITIQVQDEGLYVSFNGQFACGTSLLQFSDPPLERGQIGVYALMHRGSIGVTITNLTFTEVAKPAS